MRIFFIAIIALVFLSGCGEKDPAKKFIGKWNYVGLTEAGIVIQKDGKGFSFGKKGTSSFTWRLEEDSDGAFLDVERMSWFSKLRFDGSYLKSFNGDVTFERAK